MTPPLPEYAAFVSDKYVQKKQPRFFSAPMLGAGVKPTITGPLVFKDIEDKSRSTAIFERKDYRFLDDNHAWIEQEFNQLTAAIKEMEKDNEAERASIERKIVTLRRELDQQTGPSKTIQNKIDYQLLVLERNTQEREAFDADRGLGLYYAILLLDHAIAYGHSDQIISYQQKIQSMLGEENASKASLGDDLAVLFGMPKHTSRLRDLIGLLNIYRLDMVFCRLTWKETWHYASKLQWLDQFDNVSGRHVNIGLLDAPTDVFNALSVTLFASRFIINFGLLLKHTFAPTEAEREVPWSIRLWRELDKRHWGMVNDVVWATVNAITNYSAYFGLSSSVAPWVLAVFLVFDAFWLGYRIHLDEQAYFAKKAQYVDEMGRLRWALKNKTLLPRDRFQLEHDLKLLQRQLDQLDASRCENLACLLFCLAAAIIIMAAFAAALFFSPAFVLPVCFFICTVAVAMYMSASKFGVYMKESMLLDQDRLRKKGTEIALNRSTAQQEALEDFVCSMLKNTFMPLIMVGLFTISWPAAVVFAAIYIGYECFGGYIAKPQVPLLDSAVSKQSMFCQVSKASENDIIETNCACNTV